MQLSDPSRAVDNIVAFLQRVFEQTQKKHGVVSVSGGIDSALSVSLLVKALGAENVSTLLLPYADQDMGDAHWVVEHCGVPAQNVHEIQIEKICGQFIDVLQIPSDDILRLGNLKARVRMICAYDMAKKLDGLVCGTENKSEHYLGYFTRFGDAASDIEPISHLYKTQVRQLAEFLNLPRAILEKAPSAGLWQGQTDESELGFTYEDADKVLHEVVDLRKNQTALSQPGAFPDVTPETVKKIFARMDAMRFKLYAPYLMLGETEE